MIASGNTKTKLNQNKDLKEKGVSQLLHLILCGYLSEFLSSMCMCRDSNEEMHAEGYRQVSTWTREWEVGW